MRPIRLPSPPSGRFPGTPEMFDSGLHGVIRRAVIIGNGFAGAENQCLGLRVIRPRGGINRWLRWLPVSVHKSVDYLIRSIYGDNFKYEGNANGQKMVPSSTERTGLLDILEADAKRIARMARDTFDENGPLLVVASGRDTISVASSIRQLAPKNVFVVQIQHPRSHLNMFDLVITPCHDYYHLTPDGQKQIPWFLRRWITPHHPPDRHVFLTVGALHQADSPALRSAASLWHDELARLLKPVLVVNIGGPTGNCEYGIDLAKQLTDMLQKVLWSCGSVRISFSRRTPEKVSKILGKEFGNNPKVYIWNGEGANPHVGHLAWADAFVITADSVSMLSEACSTGKPVYVIGAERCTWKFADFQKRLQELGVVRPFTGKEDISETWSYPPLNDTAEAARRVINALAERGWTIQA
ncbi:mitochondrial fission protein ELM1 isoform X2 [Jatropha curcas]|uniref:mitochondrial fission protein ELM1 isoform X2 n=1 Tax=Jatropha curcas TaxID=180498 RepID=UPI0005FB9833|nr:mitochondrial fission protein ELM1 isoform X2 [Jatropha curcas]